MFGLAISLRGVKRLLRVRRKPAPEPVEQAPAPPPSELSPELSPEERETARALGFFCGSLTRGEELYADASAGGAAFSFYVTRLLPPELRGQMREVFAAGCLAGAEVSHIRQIDAFINASALNDAAMARELGFALRIVLAESSQGAGFVFEEGTARSVAIFRHLLSLVRRAPEVFAHLEGPEGEKFDLRAIEHRLLDERLDHAEKMKSGRRPTEPPAAAALIAQRLGIEGRLTPAAVHAARRLFAAQRHPDRAPAAEREAATRDMAQVNAALDELARSLG